MTIIQKGEPMSDLISRQAAIDALGERPTVWTDDDDYALGERNQYDMDRLAIETVPSAQLAQDLTNGCTDTISRQAAIETVRKAQSIGQAHRMLVQLPSAQPGWIPCSRELPKNKSYVLTIIYIPRRQAHIRSGWYEDGLFLNDNGDTWKATDKEVVGWMYQPKLPKPYREGGQDGKN